MSDRATAMEIGALAVKAQRASEKTQSALARAARKLGRQDHYRRTFCNQDGTLSKDGLHVLTDLAREANFGVSDVNASDADLRTNNAMRHLILHIFARLDLGSDELLKAQRQIRENTND